MAATTNIWQSTGSTDYGTTGNWSDGTPDAGDSVYLLAKAVYDINGSLNQSAVALAAFYATLGYRGRVGDQTNYLQIASSALEIGRNDEGLESPGSSRLNFDLGSGTPCAVTIIDTSMIAADLGQFPVRLLAANAGTSIRMRRGLVSIAALAGETSTIGDVELGETDSNDDNTCLMLGSGVTMDDATVLSGRLVSRAAIDALTVRGGSVKLEGAATVATLDGYGGLVVANTSGTISAANIYPGCVFDTRGANSARSITTLTIYAGDPKPRVILHPNVAVGTLVVVGNGIAYSIEVSRA